MTRIAGYEINRGVYAGHRDHEQPAAVKAITHAFSAALQLAAAVSSRLRENHQHRKTMRALSKLEAWQLKDIGYPERYRRR